MKIDKKLETETLIIGKNQLKIMPNFCPNCGKNITGKVRFCPECGAEISSFLESAGISTINNPEIKTDGSRIERDPKEKQDKETRDIKDVNISVGCSFFIPGLGQIYNGNTVKGVGFGFCILILLYFSKPLAAVIWLAGIADAYYDAAQMNNGKIPGKATDRGDMIIYGILAVLFIWGSVFATGFSSGPSGSGSGASVYNPSSGNTGSAISESLEERNIRIASEIVAEYHRTHTYYGKDIFVCGDMASDVWNMLKTQGINAKIQIGNIDTPIESIFDANHAWVLAEVAPDTWLAVETTAGILVYKTENPLYYRGHSFYTPKEFKDYSTLLTQYNDAVSKYKAALTEYNRLVTEYNNAGLFSKISLKSRLDDSALILEQRTQDLNQITQRLNALLSIS